MNACVRFAALVGVLTNLAVTASALNCLGKETPITTIPNSDIPLLYNQDPLEIFCIVEPPYNSSQLRFFQRTQNNFARVFNPEFVNETTARLYIEKPERQSSFFDCELKVKPVKLCSNKVVVDTAPEEIKNFYCRSYNLEKFECKWETPVHYIATNYSLVYNVYGKKIGCDPKRVSNNYSCIIKDYRAQEDQYFFTLTSMNRFGLIEQNFTINHYANLILGKPTDLKKQNLTAHSIKLLWNIPRDVSDFARGITTKILYQIKTIDNLKTWREADNSTVHRINRSFSYVLENLPYAHWSYDVRIFIKSELAPDEAEFWSDFQATTFTTRSERPPKPPATEVGAFVSMKRDGSRDITVYWQQIDEFYESGENFTYNVTYFDGDSYFNLPSNKSSSIRFSASLQPLNVSIASQNEYGESVEQSYIYIPADSQILLPPTRFTKTVYGNKTYDLRWQPPQQTDFDSYTVFWCSNTDLELCNGKLHFTILSPNMTRHRVMVSDDDKTYTFAISANKGYLSSGMVASGACNLPAFNATNKVAVFRRGPVGRRSVELQWDLGCSFSEGHVKGYKVSYCQRVDPSHNSSAQEQSLNIYDPQKKLIEITGLMPHTTYSFHVAVIYKDGLGYNSDSVDATTLEDKPSEPLNLQISEVTANTMIVSWDPPALKNGILLEYKVVYYKDNNESTVKETKLRVEVGDKSTQLKDKRQEIKLHGLEAFTNYTIKVKACTTDCSEGALAGRVRTAFGAPSPVRMVILNATDLEWSAPLKPGGTLDLYLVEIRDRDNNLLRNITSSTLIVRNIPQCDLSDDEHSELHYKVSAVNFDMEKDHGVTVIDGIVTYQVEKETWSGQVLKGPWSEAAVIKCGKTTSSVLFWILGIIFAVVFVLMLVLGSRKVWIRLKKMTDIDPILPPGTGPINDKDSKCPLGGSWSPPSKKDEHIPPIGAGDEALLLPPQRRAGTETKDSTNSSETTDSTTLSVKSNEAREQDAGTLDDTSDSSSLERTVSPTPTPPLSESKTQPGTANYAPFATRPVLATYNDEEFVRDDDSSSSDYSFDAGLPPGYVQSAPHQANLQRSEGSSGYVHAPLSAIVAPRPPIAPITFVPPVPLPKPILSENPLLPKLFAMEWKISPETPETLIGLDTGKTMVGQQPVSKPSTGYVSHDSVLNKHLSILSCSPAGEEPALLDPNMSEEAYCRFAWNTDPNDHNNHHSLLHDTTQPQPTVD